MEQFSNGAIWGRHPMPYFKIPRTEKYGMRCARENGDSNSAGDLPRPTIDVASPSDSKVMTAEFVFKALKCKN